MFAKSDLDSWRAIHYYDLRHSIWLSPCRVAWWDWRMFLFVREKKREKENPNRYVDDWNEVGGWAESGRAQRGRGGGGKQFWNRWACLIFSADQNKLDYVRVPCFALNSWNIRRCDPPSSLPPELSPRFTTNSERKSEFNCHRLDGSRRTAEVVEAAHFSPLKMASRPETWPLAVFLFFFGSKCRIGLDRWHHPHRS